VKDGSVAKRYATALIKVAQDTNKVEPYLEQLEDLKLHIFGHEEMKRLIVSPHIPHSQKKAILLFFVEKLKLDNSMLNFLNLLIDNDRMETLPMIALLYRDRADELLGRVRVQVQSAAPLGEMQAKLQAALERALKLKVILEAQVKPDLLGGFIVRVRDQVLDASLKRELEQLKQAIEAKAVA